MGFTKYDVIRARTWLLALGVLVTATAQSAEALVIYRIGGQDLPVPEEANSAGVDFIQLRWTDLDAAAGSSTLDLDLRPDAIASLLRDPTVNLAPTAEQQGGEFIQPPLNAQVWDADPGTVWKTAPYQCAQFLAYYLTCTDGFSNLGTMNITLGSAFEIDRIRIVSGLLNPAATAQNVRVFIAPRIPNKSFDAPPAFSPWVAEVRDNRAQVLDIPMPPNRDIGFVQVALQEHTDPIEVHDIHVYARGFAARSKYTSTILDFGKPMAWGKLAWRGQKGERAEVDIQTRSGVDDDPVRYLRYSGRGQDKTPVSAADYDKLRPGEKAGTAYDSGNWSFWSSYAFGDSLGTQIVSPGPRRYLQLQVDFRPQGTDGGGVDFVELRASVPVATNLVAEVWPVDTRTGEWTDFTYVLRPTLDVGDPGFDRLEIRTEALLGPVRSVHIGDNPVPYTVEVAEAHRLVIGLPPVRVADSGALVVVNFEAQVLRYGDRFDGIVWRSTQPLEVRQAANDGDATSEFEGNRVSVATAARNRLLLRLRDGGRVMTPNGDGVNDVALLAIQLFEITEPAPLRVEVLDLSGRRVRLLYEGERGIGAHDFGWDARDDGGRVVPPGLYLARIRAHTDGSQVETTRVLHVVY